jgi:hypothetical protein
MNDRSARVEDARLFAVFDKVIAQQRVQVGIHGDCRTHPEPGKRQAEITT